MKRAIYAVSLISVAMLMVSCLQNPPASIQKVCIKDKCFTVELAQTETKLQEGLSNRTSLEEDRGMLFIFSDERQHPFWMKNTLIPLDMIWIDDHFKVIHIQHNAPPCKQAGCPVYLTEQSSQYVLEINGQLAQKYHFTVGDSVSFQYN